MPKTKKEQTSRIRYGIGEWYGKSFVSLTARERATFTSVRSPRTQLCLPRSTDAKPVLCTKSGGVCSLRLYKQDTDTGVVEALSGPKSFCTLCPHRFKESETIFRWVGETMLGHQQPLVITEIGFLLREQADETGAETLEHEQGLEASGEAADFHEDVGQIDCVLVHPNKDHLHWCALELQAVYFSGPAMLKEYETIKNQPTQAIPFPAMNRRPDYRSSGPKRLMPQLQIKVPTLRRWGKKMAVVVDRSFFDALGKMDQVSDVSNCDIVWFIVDYEEVHGKVHLTRGRVQRTTLERAVEGLTAGRPVRLNDFEQRIRSKLERF